MASKKTLEEKKKYSAFLGNQEMEDVSFKYIFTVVDSTTNEPCFELHHLSDRKLTPEEAWEEGKKYTVSHPQDNSKKKLVKVYEQVTVGVFLDPPKKKNAPPTSGQAASVPITLKYWRSRG